MTYPQLRSLAQIAAYGSRDPGCADSLAHEFILCLECGDLHARFDPSRGHESQFVAGVLRKLRLKQDRADRDFARRASKRPTVSEPLDDPIENTCRAEGCREVSFILDELSEDDRMLLAKRFGSFGTSIPVADSAWTPSEYVRLHRLLHRLHDRLSAFAWMVDTRPRIQGNSTKRRTR